MLRMRIFSRKCSTKIQKKYTLFLFIYTSGFPCLKDKRAGISKKCTLFLYIIQVVPLLFVHRYLFLHFFLFFLYVKDRWCMCFSPLSMNSWNQSIILLWFGKVVLWFSWSGDCIWFIYWWIFDNGLQIVQPLHVDCRL